MHFALEAKAGDFVSKLSCARKMVRREASVACSLFERTRALEEAWHVKHCLVPKSIRRRIKLNISSVSIV